MKPKGRERSASVGGDPSWKANVLGHLPPRGGDEKPRARSGSVGGPEKDGPSEEQKTYAERSRQIKQKVLALDKDIATKKHGDPPPNLLNKALTNYAQTKDKALSKAAKAEQTGDYVKANAALDELDTSLKLVEGAVAREGVSEDRTRYVKRWEAVRGKVDKYQEGITKKNFGANPGGALGVAIQAFQQARSKHDNSAFGKEYDKAIQAIDELETAMNDMDVAAPGVLANVAEKERYEPRRQELDKAVAGLEKAINAGRFEGLTKPVNDFTQAKKDALGKAQKAVTSDDYAKANAALDDLDKAVKALRGAAAGDLLRQAGDGKGAGKLRGKAQKLLQDDPDILRAIEAEKGGRDLLDSMVKDVGDKAKSQADKDFVKAAVLARYKMVKLEGNLTTKALPRLYKVLGKVPDSHVADNQFVSEIKRDKDKGDGSGDYARCETGGHLNLNLGKTGRGHDKEEFDCDDDVPKDLRPKGGKPQKFDATTLHEVGHAVDDKLSFMKSKGSAADQGGWKEHTVEQIADVAGTGKGFYGAYPTLPRPFLQGYLSLVLRGTDDPSTKLKDKVKATAAVPTAEEVKKDPGYLQALVDYERLRKDGWLQGIGDIGKQPRWLTAAADTAQRDAAKKVALPPPDKKALAVRVIELIFTQGLAPDAALAEAAGEIVAVADPTTGGPDWNGMATHAAVQWCKDIRMNGGKGVWSSKGSVASSVQVGGRVYQESYAGKWNSYDLAARQKGISSYQFRADGEWFAELYAAYNLGKLPENHPNYKVFSWIDS